MFTRRAGSRRHKPLQVYYGPLFENGEIPCNSFSFY